VVVIGTVATNAPRGDGPRAATLGIPGAVDVRFTASDGVPLGAWLVPGTRHAAVVVLHGSHSARKSTTRYVRFLHRAGYTVLAYDARGHGSSGGNENAYGWYGDRDLAGAVAYLRDSGVKRIGALGLSMGGEEALRAAANGVGLGAVVADGAGSGTLGDAKVEEGTNSPLFTAVTWIGMRTVALFSGDREPVPLIEIVGRVHVPVLLVASNRRNEHRMNEVFRDRIGSRATRLWYLGDTGHTQGLARHPREYREHVLGFLESALR
jgi:pimeloyl-ACP methyl ester carboxylesterase